MKPIAFLLVAFATVAGVLAVSAPASGHADEVADPVFGIKIPPGYRDSVSYTHLTLPTN